ncbi:MAG: TIGR04551 family protein [Polyangiaceae bacterium]|nr:TIGR04551 family protein [Polyangiaceae bacterium]
MQSASNALLLAAGVVLLGSAAAQAQTQPAPEKKAPPARAELPAPPPVRTQERAPAAEPVPAEPAEPAGGPEPSMPAGEARADTETPEPSAEPEPEEQPPAELPPTPPAEQASPAVRGLPLLPQASMGAAAEQGAPRSSSTQGRTEAPADRVYAEQWWTHARPTLELHGYFRLRAELFHKFALDRRDAPGSSLWPQPVDNTYTGVNDSYGAGRLCTPDEAGTGDADDPTGKLVNCRNNTQAGANVRFRINPELHISDNLRVMSQVDLLDNLVLGSTPAGYKNAPAGGTGGYQVVPRSGYVPFGYYDDTQEVPSAGINSMQDSIRVKRVWAEYETPLGQLRFGRMPDQWGLGILHNGGDDYDADYQSTVDRVMFTTSLKPLSLYFSGAWDFPNEGLTSGHLSLPQGQAYDLGQLDDVDQYSVIIARKLDSELTELALAKGKLVVNGGIYLTYRKQLLANDAAGMCAPTGADALGCTLGDLNNGYVRRGAQAWIPDVWLQVLYKKFRFEAEAVTVQGTIEGIDTDPGGSNYEGWRISQWGVAGELSQKLVEDRLKLSLHSGWASGDPDASQEGGGIGLSPGLNGLQPQLGDDTFSTFRFNPNYRVDLILHRNLLTRVQGTYYFRPGVEYDFLRNPEGQRLGGAFAAIWSRASQFVQTPGHKRDLGIELNGTVYFQGKDGALNDDVEQMGGFYTMLQYGVLFPLGGLEYQPGEVEILSRNLGSQDIDTGIAHVFRWYLGVLF